MAGGRLVKLEAQAGGKVILLGEHFVVYGGPAVACGISLGARVTAEPAEQFTLSVEGKTFLSNPASPLVLERALHTMSAHARRPLRCMAALDLPAGGGLGSSAALAAALARVILIDNGKGLDPSRIAELCKGFEEVCHGRASGVDVAAVVAGGWIEFTRVRGPQGISLQKDVLLVVGHSGEASATAERVADVAQWRGANAARWDGLMQANSLNAERAVRGLVQGDIGAVGAATDAGHLLLVELGLSTASTESMVRTAKLHGAVGAKLTGAGGGGAVVAIAENLAVANAIVSAWEAAGFRGLVSASRSTTLPPK